MKCTQCQTDNPAAARFCMHCGAALPRRCPNCQAALPDEARFCMHCGQAVNTDAPWTAAGGASPATSPPVEGRQTVLAGERRPATIILADVKGSTALAERVDTETWVEIMNQVFHILGEEIYRYGGEIDQYRGDGLVAFFGVPTAHENDPERAVLAALSMQEAIARYAVKLVEREGAPAELLLRVGVNTGEVIAAQVGDRRRHSEDTAMGRAIALAARMESAAEPGTVLVTENTYRLVAPQFEWQALGQIAVKGVSQPVTVYRPLARSAAAPGQGRGIPGMSSPLVGRQAEFRALREAVERLQGGIGGIVTLVGEAGIGKSRLTTEARRQSTIPHAQSPTLALQWIEGRCLSYATDVAYQLWTDMLRGLLDVPSDAPQDAVRGALARWARALCAEDFDDVYPFLGRLLTLSLDDETEAVLRGLGAEGIKAATFRAMETAVERAAWRRPLVVVCEDLHWADPTSLALLERLLALTDRVPVLFVCVFRPETAHGCWQIREHAARHYRHRHTDLRLDPLPDAESERLVGHLLFSASALQGEAGERPIEGLDPALKLRILGHADGNPFYLEEILRSLVESGAIVCDEAACRWQAADDATAVVIPETLQGVLTARIDRLPEETRRVLQLASVIGRAFSYRVLAAIADSAPLPLENGSERRARTKALDDHLVVLQREQMLRERARVPEREFIFKHVLTQEAAYSSLLRRDCRAIHRRVAEALEQLYPGRLEEQVGLLAHHWERAGAPEKAVPYLLRVGEQARVAYANREAIAHFRRIQTLLDGALPASVEHEAGAWRLAAARGLGQVYLGIGQVDQGEGYLRQAIALGRARGVAPRELVRLFYWLGEAVLYQGRFDERICIGEEGLALLGDDRESVEAALMNQTIAMGHRTKGNLGLFRELTSRTAGFVQRLSYSEELRPAYHHIGDLYVVNREREKATAWLQVFEEQAARHHDMQALAETHALAARLLEATGDLHAAADRHRQALELLSRIGHVAWTGVLLHEMAKTLSSLGELDRAEEAARRSLDMYRAHSMQHMLRFAHLGVGIAHLCLGNWKDTIDVLKKDMNFLQLGALHRWELFYALGRAHLAQGHGVEARQQFVQAIAEMGAELARYDTRDLARTLSGLESAAQDPAAFRACCRHLLEIYPWTANLPFVSWYLEPAHIEASRQVPQRDDLTTGPSSDWEWQDPFGDCAFTAQSGLEIHAANGRDLWGMNLSAPRLQRPVAGDLVLQVVCAPVSDAQPAIGGLLLWQDERHYLRFDRGTFGSQDITLIGCLQGEHTVIGRGRLPQISTYGPTGERAGQGDRVWLRLERSGKQVAAYCSPDGERWFAVGQATFTARDPVQVGVYASGHIDRTIYHGAYPDGTVVRFESFQRWQA